MRFLISASKPDALGGLIELRPFKAALAGESGVVAVTLQSYSSRQLGFELSTAEGNGAPTRNVLPHPRVVQFSPGASQRIRIGLRLGALHVERAFCLVLRESLAPRRDASFLPLQIALLLTVAPVALRQPLHAA